MSETYLERSKKMSWMVLNMSRTTLKKFDFFRDVSVFIYIYIYIYIFWIFVLEHNWNKKDAGGPYDQLGGGMRP